MSSSSRHDDLPSLPFRSHISSSNPPAQDISETEMIHRDALAAAQAEHKRIREGALLAFKVHQLREEQQKIREREDRLREVEQELFEHNNRLREQESRLKELEKAERDRLKRESELAERNAKLRELQKRSAGPDSTLQNQRDSSRLEPLQNPHLPYKSSELAQPPSAQNNSSAAEVSSWKSTSPPEITAARPPPTQRPRTSLEAVGTQAQPPTKPLAVYKQPVSNGTAQHILPGTPQYLEIHSRLKKFRSLMEEEAKRSQELKSKMGEMRREIRKSVGQLTEGRGANKQPMTSIVNTLKEALHRIPSAPVDPSTVMLAKPEPLEGAANNGETLPLLFLYLLNNFAKAVVAQFIDEAGVSPKAADPIGVVAVSVFAQADLCWRGESLIDILICKMRVSCPVLFGIRGSEMTEEGRARLGWKRSESGGWVHEQVHNTRMTGLGAGYAALSLRDFTKSPHKNPYPPTMYWRTIASIVGTSPEEMSSTQFTVLKAMIENNEQRFMTFYGHAARAALQVMLVDFPSRAPEKTVAVSSLMVLGDKLKRDVGLLLRPARREMGNS